MSIIIKNLNQLLQLPSELPLELTVSLRELDIHPITRYLPRRRVSGIGSLNGHPAFIKTYFSPNSAKKEYLKEKAAAELLIKNKINTPALLGFGEEDGIFWLAFELLDQPSDLVDHWAFLNSNEPARIQVFKDLLDLNLSIYRAGFIQADPHLGNFIFSKDRIYVVDAGGIKKTKPNTSKPMLKNLGLLIAQFPRVDHQCLFIETYHFLCENSSFFGVIAEKEFEEIFLYQFRKRLRRYGKKVLRSCTQITRIKNRQLHILCQRDQYKELAESLSPACLDEKIKSAPLLKDGGTATVAIVTLGGKELIVKRYNYLGFLSALRRSLKPSRARRSWVGGHLLEALQIDTPAPVAILEEKSWYGVKRAYILNERIHGDTALEYYLQSDSPDPAVLHHFDEYFHSFCAARISHGDMKATNFIVSDEKLNVIDLDSIVFHKNDKRFAKAINADFIRLLKNWQEKEALHRDFKAVCDRHIKRLG